MNEEEKQKLREKEKAEKLQTEIDTITSKIESLKWDLKRLREQKK